MSESRRTKEIDITVEIDADVDREIVAAAEFAESSPFPEPDDRFHGVYEDGKVL